MFFISTYGAKRDAYTIIKLDFIELDEIVYYIGHSVQLNKKIKVKIIKCYIQIRLVFLNVLYYYVVKRLQIITKRGMGNGNYCLSNMQRNNCGVRR